MVEIKINGVNIDMFPDTKLLGNYSPVEISSNNGFEVPYTDSFTIPLTNTNCKAIGFDKSKLTFDGEKRIAEVYNLDTLVFSGILEIESAIVETLDEAVDIRIIDFASYIFNKGESMKIGCIMDNVINIPNEICIKDLHRNRYGNNKNAGLAYIDQTGFESLYNKVPAYPYKGFDRGSLPIVFQTKSILESIAAKFKLSLNSENLPIDIKNGNTVTSFPMDYVSSSPRPTTITIETPEKIAYTYPTEKETEEIANRYSEFKYLSKFVNGSETRVDLDSDSFIIQKTVNQTNSTGGKSNVTIKSSVIGFDVMFKPVSLDVNIPNGLFRDYNNARLSNISTTKFQLFMTIYDAIGNNIGQIKVADLTFTNGCSGLESYKISEDYLFSDKIKFEAGQGIYIEHTLVPDGICEIRDDTGILVGKYVLDSLLPVANTGRTGIYNIKRSGTISVEYDVLYGDEHEEHLKNQICSSILSESCMFSYNNDSNSPSGGYMKNKIEYIDIRESLNNTGITVSSFLTDLCRRFNCKVSSLNGELYITALSGSDEVIDITNGINSSIEAGMSGSESSIKSFSVENKAFNCRMDKLFNDRAFGSSDEYMIDENGKDEVKVELTSSIYPTQMTGSRRTSQSAGVTTLFKKYANLSNFGFTDFNEFTNSESGIRYGYITSKYKEVVPLYPTVASNVPDTVGYNDSVDLAYYTPNTLPVRTLLNPKNQSLWTVGFAYNFNVYSTYSGTAGSTLGTGRLIYRNGAICLEIKFTGNYSDTTYRADYETSIIGSTTNGDLINNVQCNIHAGSHNGGYLKPSRGVAISKDLNASASFSRSTWKFTIKGSTSYMGSSSYPTTLVIPVSCSPETKGSTKIETDGARIANFRVGYDLFVADLNPSESDSATLFEVSNNSGDSTLAYSNVGIPSGVTINAYDRYFKDYKDSVLKNYATVVNVEAYITNVVFDKLLSGCKVSIYGNEYLLLSASDYNIINTNGGLVKLKLAKITR